ncbi:MAG: hypothetical protein AAGG11_10170 [Pseudomonadota bacterium]
MQYVASGDSADAALKALEAGEYLARIDPNVEPTMYRCATVSAAELAQLRRVKDIVRMGRVQRVTREGLTLDCGALNRGPDTLYIDCTADGLASRPAVPVFADSSITLQTVRGCQQVFSAALIARVETLADASQEQKNQLTGVIPHPDTPRDFFSNALSHVTNVMQWNQNDTIRQWLDDSRLSPGTMKDAAGADPAMVMRAVQNLNRFTQSE